jgi:hypothetical protein
MHLLEMMARYKQRLKKMVIDQKREQGDAATRHKVGKEQGSISNTDADLHPPRATVRTEI